MKRFISFGSIFFYTVILSANASLKSPFKSTVPELSIPNSHEVSTRIYRGMAPLGKVEELKKFGITDILIFKNQTKDEIDRERAEVSEVAPEIQITQMDFPWHNVESYVETCEKTIDALRLMRQIDRDPSRKLFYHCTVGEDRTGILSGLWSMLKFGKKTSHVFKNQMCENGYEAGNPQKPAYVVNEIREDLTPLFMMMAKKIEIGKLKIKNLSKSICYSNIDFESELPECENSSKYE